MTITFHAAAMQRALAFSGQIIERRNTIPILGNILIEAFSQTVKITATDLDIQGSMEIEAINPIPEPIRFTIGIGTFTHFIRHATGKVTITIAPPAKPAGDQIAKIEADDATMQVRLLCPPEDFPMMPALEDMRVITIAEATLLKTLSATRPCISTEETSYYLNGTYLHAVDGKLIAVATDGHRLAKYAPQIDWHLEAAIIPKKTVDILIRNMAKDTNRKINISQKGNRIEVEHDNWTIQSKVIDGTFPDYTRVIPSKNDSIEITLTHAGLQRIPSGSAHQSLAIRLAPDEGKMTAKIWGDDIEFSVPITGRGPAIGFNERHLKVFARQFGTIRLQGNSAGDPCLVTAEDPDYTGVIMPMRV